MIDEIFIDIIRSAFLFGAILAVLVGILKALTRF